MNICMAGALGRMGRRILELAAADPELGIGGGFDLPEKAGEGLSVGHEGDSVTEVALSVTATEAIVEADVLIDFTIASVCMGNVRAAVEAGKAVVLGTTGLSEHDKKELEVLAHSVPIVLCSEFQRWRESSIQTRGRGGRRFLVLITMLKLLKFIIIKRWIVRAARRFGLGSESRRVLTFHIITTRGTAARVWLVRVR